MYHVYGALLKTNKSLFSAPELYGYKDGMPAAAEAREDSYSMMVVTPCKTLSAAVEIEGYELWDATILIFGECSESPQSELA